MTTVDSVRLADPRGTATPQAWHDICALDDLLPERGAAALLGDTQIALFRLHDATVLAVGNLDPFSGANVIARGIVGTRGDRPCVASPMYKQHFDLTTGVCAEDPAVSLPVYRVRVADGRVLVHAEVLPTQ